MKNEDLLFIFAYVSVYEPLFFIPWIIRILEFINLWGYTGS